MRPPTRPRRGAGASLDVETFYADYDRRHPDDRIRLFAAVAEEIGPATVLYPGSYIDIAPSVLLDDVTYVDTDRRAARFFAQADAVAGLVQRTRSATAGAPTSTATIRFHHADYRSPLPVADGSAHLLVSLYAGFVSEHCARYLAPDSWLLANPSHGDVAMAVLNPTLALAAVITTDEGGYRVRTDHLDRCLIPKRGHQPTADELRDTNRGIAYTLTAYAYLFRKVDTP
ncbi:hypothetical protein BH23ACT10_BH23ACT10_25070 [soil metagenome]